MMFRDLKADEAVSIAYWNRNTCGFREMGRGTGSGMLMAAEI